MAKILLFDFTMTFYHSFLIDDCAVFPEVCHRRCINLTETVEQENSRLPLLQRHKKQIKAPVVILCHVR